MLHEPSTRSSSDPAAGYKMRLGVWMFIPYAVVYAGFVLINLVKPVVMETTVIFGLNLAVVYGFGLIILALVMALIYNQFCAWQEHAVYRSRPSKEKE
ncbi:MAG: DUF485 domain-containing protein [Candidatus Eisenbacteria bacterium]|nr:DUF485 domain-containing protein [Candidatus Eisenbacteria bacterium]